MPDPQLIRDARHDAARGLGDVSAQGSVMYLETILPLSDTRTKQLARALAPVLGRSYQATLSLLRGDPAETAEAAYDLAPRLAVDSIASSVLGHPHPGGLPAEPDTPMAELASVPFGLVLVVGGTGTGRTTAARELVAAARQLDRGVRVWEGERGEWEDLVPWNNMLGCDVAGTSSWPKVSVVDEIRSPGGASNVHRSATVQGLSVAVLHANGTAPLDRMRDLLLSADPTVPADLVERTLAHDLVALIDVGRLPDGRYERVIWQRREPGAQSYAQASRRTADRAPWRTGAAVARSSSHPGG